MRRNTDLSVVGLAELKERHPGAVADMVLVRGNPTERIPAAPDIVAVVRQGVVLQSQDLLAVADVAQ